MTPHGLLIVLGYCFGAVSVVGGIMAGRLVPIVGGALLIAVSTVS